MLINPVVPCLTFIRQNGRAIRHYCRVSRFTRSSERPQGELNTLSTALTVLRVRPRPASGGQTNEDRWLPDFVQQTRNDYCTLAQIQRISLISISLLSDVCAFWILLVYYFRESLHLFVNTCGEPYLSRYVVKTLTSISEREKTPFGVS